MSLHEERYNFDYVDENDDSDVGRRYTGGLWYPSGCSFGRWQPVPGQPKAQQGVRLEKGGKASSLNMATLVYESWELDGNNLKLKGKSIGNKQTIPFEETVIVKEVTPENMTWTVDGQDFTFTRKP